MSIIPRTKEDVWRYLDDLETQVRYIAIFAGDLNNHEGSAILHYIADQMKTQIREIIEELETAHA